MSQYKKYLLVLSLPLFALLVAVSIAGFFKNGFYSRETSNWATQAMAQDFVDLFFISPILLITTLLAYKNNFTALVIWGGTILFLIYAFAIYCFAVHFNILFIPYCLTFGLSVYSFVYFLYINISSTSRVFPGDKFPRKSTAAFLILIAMVFYILWLSEIIPATINNSVPKSLIDTGVLTNPIHVIDISVCLPGIFLTAVLLLKKKSASLFLIPSVIVFCTEMSLSIAALIIFMNRKNQIADITPLYFTGIITLVGIGLLIKFIVSVRSSSTSHYSRVT